MTILLLAITLIPVSIISSSQMKSDNRMLPTGTLEPSSSSLIHFPVITYLTLIICGSVCASRAELKKGVLNSKSYRGLQAAFVVSFDFTCGDVQH